MHAALISLILMSGACGDPPPETVSAPPHDVLMSMPMDDSFMNPCPVTVSVPPLCVPGGCGNIGCRSCAYGNHPLYRCCGLAEPIGPTMCPACSWGYRPACYFYPDHRMLFDPNDYTMHYDYREQFAFPWNDPRCPCATLPLRK